RFCRYADDCNVYVRSRRAAERVMASLCTFLETKLKLRVNREKSAVDRPWKRKFLGFSLYHARGGEVRIRLAPQTIQRLKARLRALGLPDWRVHELANARKGPWRMASGPLNSVLTTAWWRSQGLLSIVDRYLQLRQLWRTA